MHRYLGERIYLCESTGVIQVGTTLYYQRRLRELLKLEEIRRGLKDAV